MMSLGKKVKRIKKRFWIITVTTCRKLCVLDRQLRNGGLIKGCRI